jgi:hypothetical protein
MRIRLAAALAGFTAFAAAAQTGNRTIFVEDHGPWHVRCFEGTPNGPVGCSLTLLHVQPDGSLLMFTVLRNALGNRFLAASANRPGDSAAASVLLDGHPAAETKDCEAATCVFARPDGVEFVDRLKTARSLQVRYQRTTGRTIDLDQDLDGIGEVIAAWHVARQRYER